MILSTHKTANRPAAMASMILMARFEIFISAAKIIKSLEFMAESLKFFVIL
jgi:hypothetical protein